MSQRQITLPTDDLNLILDLLNEKRCDLCEENRRALKKRGGIKTSSMEKEFDRRNKLYDNIKRINKHIVMTFKVID